MKLKLAEILHSIDEEKESGLISIDSWRWPDVDHLITMGFIYKDDYHLQTPKPPKMIIYKKKNRDVNGKEKIFFFIKEPKKPLKRFETFNDVIDFFDTYEQPDLYKNI